MDSPASRASARVRRIGGPVRVVGLALPGDWCWSLATFLIRLDRASISRSSRTTWAGRCRRRWWRATSSGARGSSARGSNGARSRTTSWSSRRCIESGSWPLRRLTGWRLEAVGAARSRRWRRRSAAWGLFELSRRRGMPARRSLAVAAFAVFPLTIRYGRAFQPDAAMLGAVVAGLACWDDRESRRRAGPGSPRAGALLALGFALKIIVAPFAAGPAGLVGGHPGAPTARACSLAAGATLVPALLWYAWADHLVAAGGGSRASADNRAIWLGLLAPSALLQPGDPGGWRCGSWSSGRSRRSGPALAVCGLDRRQTAATRLLAGLGPGVALATLALLAAKLHHEYYWLVLAPVAAAGVGQALDRLAEPARGGCWRRRPRCACWSWPSSRPGRPGGRRPSGRAWRRPRGRSRRIVPRPMPGWSRRRRCCSRPTAAAAGWSGPRRPRGGRPASGAPRPPTRSAARSIWSITTGAAGPATSPTSATAAADPRANGLARRGPPTIQGHSRPARGPHRRPGIVPIRRDAPHAN